MKCFWLVDYQTCELEKEFLSNTAREAALKAATREAGTICLVESQNGKLHVFKGTRVPLAEDEQNSYTRARNISSKPQVSKIAYRNMKMSYHRNRLEDACREFANMLS